MELQWRISNFLRAKQIDKKLVVDSIDPKYRTFLSTVLDSDHPPKEMSFQVIEAIAEAIRAHYAGDLGISDIMGFSKRVPPKYDDEGRDSAVWSRGS